MDRQKYVSNEDYRNGYIDGRKEGYKACACMAKTELNNITTLVAELQKLIDECDEEE